MIGVHNTAGFKKAMKKDNREIYGYIDIKYQNKNYVRNVTQIPTPLDIVMSNGNGIINDGKVMTKYATLEDNYTLLDGSFIVWNDNIIDEDGYVSNEIFENINDNTIIITNSSTSKSSKGINIYFKENLPFDFNVTITDANNNVITDEIRNNQSYTYQWVFPNEIYISTIELNILSIEFPKNRIRIAFIDLNLGDLYYGDELISFDVTEELDLLGESLPINTCDVNINNYPDSHGGNKFDPINPMGITPLLTSEVRIEPFIGVLTEEDGIVYARMGTFYLDDWSSDSDGNVTISGKSILNKLKGIIIHPNSAFFSSSAKNISNLESFITNTIDVDTNFLSYSNWWNNQFVDDEYLLDYLQSTVPYLLYYDNFSTPHAQYRKFYISRYNIMTLNELDFSPVDSIPRNLLLKDVDYSVKDKIKQVTVKQNGYGVYSNYRNSTIISSISYTLTSTEDYLWFRSDNHLVDGTLSLNTSGSATATLIGYNNKLICIKVTGNIGSTVSISCSGQIADTQNVLQSYTYNNPNVENGETINIDLSNSINVSTTYFKNVFFGLDKNYIIKANTMGDPTLEIGDTISIQTRYSDINDGYKDMIITKQKFMFDGGLQCEIEGVGD